MAKRISLRRSADEGPRQAWRAPSACSGLPRRPQASADRHAEACSVAGGFSPALALPASPCAHRGHVIASRASGAAATCPSLFDCRVTPLVGPQRPLKPPDILPNESRWFSSAVLAQGVQTLVPTTQDQAEVRGRWPLWQHRRHRAVHPHFEGRRPPPRPCAAQPPQDARRTHRDNLLVQHPSASLMVRWPDA
jgi:hypothetical protein